MMDNEKNINLTLMQPEDEEDVAVLSLSTLIKQARKYVFAWIVIAVVLLLFTASGVMLFRTSSYSGDIKSLVSYNYSGIETGLDPAGNTLDVNKIKSPTVIESALTNLNIPLKNVENIRRNISIKGVLSESDINKMSMYQSIYDKGGNAALTAVDNLINVGKYPSFYIITFDYSGIGFDLSTSKQIMDEILTCYQSYFFETYGYNKALGSEVTAVDYKDYDYSEAVDVFQSTLDSLQTYLNNLKSSDSTNFRSNVTGYSFDDLISSVNMLKDVDLDSISAYITVNNITSDKNLLITYYQYKIDRIQRQQNTAESKLGSISDSIANYEKDSILIMGSENSDQTQTDYKQASEKYDSLIEDKVATQQIVSKYKQQIGFYNDRIDALKDSTATSSADKEQIVSEKLDVLNNKVEALVNEVNDTSDEYYEKVSFAKAYNILVPATGVEPTVVTGDLVLPIIISETLLFLAYIGVIIISGFSIDYKNRKHVQADSENHEE